VTTINLEHTLTTGLAPGSGWQNQNYNYQTTRAPVYVQQPTEAPIYVQQTTRAHVYVQRTTTRKQWTQTATTQPAIQTTTETSLPDRIQGNDFECGIPKVTTTGLVINGEFASRGQFPW
jgi:hypothetical protein